MSDPDERAKRVRSLLSSYYGQSNSDSGLPSSHSKQQLPPIDTHDFDADAWVSDTLANTPLDQLQTKCISMRYEAKTLDGDAQMLVYENYAKFISATDIVSDVGKNVAVMEGKIAELKTRMQQTTAKATAVDQSLSLKRDQVEQLSGVRSLINKLQAAFEVPGKMRIALDRGAVDLAGNYYAAIRPLLVKYGNDDGNSAFISVKKEANDAAEVARGVLRKSMKRAAERSRTERDARRKNRQRDVEGEVELNDSSEPDTTVGTFSTSLTASECVHLLEKLGVGRGELREEFVASHLSSMERALDGAEGLPDMNTTGISTMGNRNQLEKDTTNATSTNPYQYPSPSTDPRAFVEKLDSDFLEAFHSFANEYCELFSDEESKNELTNVSKKLFQRYFGILKKALDVSTGAMGYVDNVDGTTGDSLSVDTPSLVPAKGLMAALAVMAADLSGAHRLVPKVGLGDRAQEVVERAVRGRVNAAFLVLEGKLVEAISDAEKISNSDELQQKSESICAVFAGGISIALDDCRNLFEERPVMVASWRDEFEGLVRAKSQQITQRVLQRLVACVGSTDVVPAQFKVPADDHSPLSSASRAASDKHDVSNFELVSLASTRITVFISHEGIDTSERLLDRCFPRRSGEGTRDADLAKLRNVAIVASLCLASAYTKAVSSRIGSLVRRTTVTQNWLEMREPRDVRPVVDAIVDEINLVDAVAGKAGIASESTSQSTNAFADEPEKSSPSCFTPSHVTRDTLTATVVCRVLKSWQLQIDERTFNRGGYHTMELDLKFLERKVLETRIGSGSPGQFYQKAIAALLKECTNSCASRSVDQTPLDPAIVSRILDAKQSRGG